MKPALFLLMAAALVAQSSDDQTPLLRGAYYHEGADWVALPMHLLNPFPTPGAREFLSLGQPDAVSVIPGAHAAIHVTAPKPTLYLRGFPPSSGIVLVQQSAKSDYRELRMKISRDYEEWVHLRKQDVREIDLTQSSQGLIALSPKNALTPGEYAIVTVLEPGNRGVRVEFDFSVQ